MKRYSLRRVIEAADAVIPERPARISSHNTMRQHREMLLAGIGYEMACIVPSTTEIGMVIGTTANTTGAWLTRWREIPWQDRYQWLRLVEGRLARETDTVDASVL